MGSSTFCVVVQVHSLINASTKIHMLVGRLYFLKILEFYTYFTPLPRSTKWAHLPFVVGSVHSLIDAFTKMHMWVAHLYY